MLGYKHVGAQHERAEYKLLTTQTQALRTLYLQLEEADRRDTDLVNRLERRVLRLEHAIAKPDNSTVWELTLASRWCIPDLLSFVTELADCAAHDNGVAEDAPGVVQTQ